MELRTQAPFSDSIMNSALKSSSPGMTAKKAFSLSYDNRFTFSDFIKNAGSLCSFPLKGSFL